jgi:hypothetical protein
MQLIASKEELMKLRPLINDLLYVDIVPVTGSGTRLVDLAQMDECRVVLIEIYQDIHIQDFHAFINQLFYRLKTKAIELMKDHVDANDSENNGLLLSNAFQGRNLISDNFKGR